MAEGPVAHLAGPVATIGTVRRQRCLWCGVLLDEWDLVRTYGHDAEGGDLLAVPKWAENHWVLIDGPVHVDLGIGVPEEACCRG